MSNSVEGLSGSSAGVRHELDKPLHCSTKLCRFCEEPIPLTRLKAKPNATECVPCLEAHGDVPRLKRLDESTRNGEVQTLFTNDPYADVALARQRFVVPPDDALRNAVGDDSFLTKAQTSIGVEMPFELVESYDPSKDNREEEFEAAAAA